MPLRDKNRGFIIISEAALHLTLTEKGINTHSLLNELEIMATDHCCDDRLILLPPIRYPDFSNGHFWHKADSWAAWENELS